jgi:hypothetical protein
MPITASYSGPTRYQSGIENSASSRIAYPASRVRVARPRKWVMGAQERTPIHPDSAVTRAMPERMPPVRKRTG